MTLNFAKWVSTCVVVLAMAATLAGQTARPSRITQEISNASRVTLHGNVRAGLTPQRDLGPVEDGMELRLYLVLQRSPEQQAALDNLLARQQQPTAAEYHNWLTPKQFGQQFGASQDDIAKITTWLEAQGMKVNGVMNNAMMIHFTASAAQVREVFGTQLHYYNIQGGKYAANAQDPQIPAALAPVVSGIKGLIKIPPQSHRTKVHPMSYDAATHSWHNLDAAGTPAYNNPYTQYPPEYDVTPQDYYTIYNVNPVFNGGNLGANATIAVIEESDIEYGTVDPSTGAATGGDVATFRNLFGVPGTLNMFVYHGYGTVSCAAPGIDPSNSGEESEAALDAEWANALAPSAKLIFMSCVYNNTGNGIWDSMTALVDNNLADVMSMSYGGSELNYTAGDYTFQDPLYAQAAAQGQSIIISAGDSGSDVADQNAAPISTANPTGTAEYCTTTSATTADPTGTAICGINVSGMSSSPLVTAAGGTDFADQYDSLKGTIPQSTYWNATNTATYGDALGYVPETAWNSSCAGSLLAEIANGGPFTGAAFCGLGPANAPIEGNVIAGSGGFSTNYAVPAYQLGITGYSGTKRAQPDVSMFASSGWWGHLLIFCDSYDLSTDKNAGNVPCTSPSTFGGAGGTSFVAPSLAGVGGLLVSAGGRQGLLNPGLYALGKAQFTASATKTACYSNGQTSNIGITAGLPASTCTFNDVTTGNNDVPCSKYINGVSGALSPNCYYGSASYGMLSLNNNSSLSVAYPATAGYDAATGIGSLNVANLITNWNKAFTSTTGMTASPTSLAANQSTTLTATVSGGVPTGSTTTPTLSGKVNFTAGVTALGYCTISGGGGCSLSVLGSQMAIGSNQVTATFTGSTTYPSSTSSIVTVNVTQPVAATTTAVSATPTSVTIGGAVTLTATVSPSTATGTVTFKAGSTTVGTPVAVVSGVAALATTASVANGFTAGSTTITATYNGDAGDGVSSGTAGLTVNKAGTTTTVSVPNTGSLGASVTLTAMVNPAAATGTVTFKVGLTTLGLPATVSGGTATLNIAATTANGFALGSNSISAVYAGDTNYTTSASSATNLTLTAPTTTVVTLSPTSVALGSSTATSLVFTATVTVASGTPTGTVQFQVGAVPMGGPIALSGGTATVTSHSGPVTAAGFTVGNDTITATYTPTTGSLYGSSVGTTTETVTAPAYTMTPSVSSVALTKGGSQAVTITLASTTYADTTAVQATSSSPLITLSPSSGNVTLAANGTATFNTTITASSSAANHAPRMPWTGGMIAFGVVLAGIPLARRRKRVAIVLLTALTIATLGFMMACGGGGPAAPRNYQVTITGSGGISTVITVTVQ